MDWNDHAGRIHLQLVPDNGNWNIISNYYLISCVIEEPWER